MIPEDYLQSIPKYIPESPAGALQRCAVLQCALCSVMHHRATSIWTSAFWSNNTSNCCSYFALFLWPSHILTSFVLMWFPIVIIFSLFWSWFSCVTAWGVIPPEAILMFSALSHFPGMIIFRVIWLKSLQKWWCSNNADGRVFFNWLPEWLPMLQEVARDWIALFIHNRIQRSQVNPCSDRLMTARAEKYHKEILCVLCLIADN